MNNYFAMLNGINVNDKTEKKNGLTYLSWAWAWGEIKKLFPAAVYTIYENRDGWNYHTDGKTAWVKTGVTVNGIEHIEYLPVMDTRNKSIPVGNITSFDVNKAIQRSLTKAAARHGLGLYIYAGEDLPESEQAEEGHKEAPRAEQKVTQFKTCKHCGQPIKDGKKASGKAWPALEVAKYAKDRWGIELCYECAGKAAEAEKAEKMAKVSSMPDTNAEAGLL